MEASTKQTLRPSKLGVVDFETVDAAQQLQDDMLRRLERVLSDPGQLAGLADCHKIHCGRFKCSEVCQVGTRRRRLKEIPAVFGLLQNSVGPVYEVRLGRGAWAQPAGKLNRVSIAAAKKLNRWALDRLYNPDVIAVGTFKVSISREQGGWTWIFEIHQIISGAQKTDLEKVFSTKRYVDGNFLMVKEVTNLGQTISNVLKRDLQDWQHPYPSEITPARPKNSHRDEYYGWLLDLRPSDRMVRYGCDRYFRGLKKKTRVPKPKKRRPYPYWLARHMYGSHPQNCRCIRCMGNPGY
jgi:hypothetical protein